jgi:hypothetical protein
MLLLGVVLAGCAFGAIWFFVLRPRTMSAMPAALENVPAAEAKREPPPTVAATPEPEPDPDPEPEEPEQAEADEPAEEPTEPTAAAQPAPQVAAPPQASPPKATQPAREPAERENKESAGGNAAASDALKAAISGKDIPKVVLDEEEPGAGEGTKPAPAATKPPFDTGAAKAALSSAAANASACKQPDGPSGAGKVQVTFAQSGRATTATIVSGPFSGTAVGGCVARAFRGASVPAFSGDPVTVSKSFSIAE